MRRLLAALFVVSGLVLGAASAARGDAAHTASRPGVKRPDAAVAAGGCVTDSCHIGIKSQKVTHAPVAADACDSCHDTLDVKKHTFAVRREKAELCTFCHEFSVKNMPAVHAPVKKGECLGCHDPHGGATRALTLEKDTRSLCGRCHESVTKGKPHAHGPVAQGACDSCHPPHAAKFDKLLDARGTDLCLACHKEMEPALASARVRHKALEKGCEGCHDAHGSALPNDLKAAPPQLCWSCHKPMQDKVAAATVKHSAVDKDRACMTCHAAHTSALPRLLSRPPVQSCLGCHDKSLKNARGETVAAVKELANPLLVQHGQIRDGMCAGCHDVHGGSRANLLTRDYSSTFYKKFEEGAFAFCFGCHQADLAKTEKTTKATNFRNGEKNLHYVHANTGNHDRNCRACHSTHVSAGPKLVRPTIKYGKWDVPVNFQKTATGGSCAAGCHAAYAYDREKPVATTAPAARPPATGARLPEEEPRAIAWTAREIGGGVVKIPDGRGRVTVLLIIAADDEATRRALDLLAGTLPEKDVQAVVVLTGKGAAAAGETIKTGGWARIADDAGEAAATLGVRGWPVALVLKKDGTQAARVSGAAGVMMLKLPAYIELAAGRINAAGAATRTAPADVPESDAATRGARALRAARAMLSRGEPRQALALLPAEITGNDAAGIRGEALVALGRHDEALAQIAALGDAGALIKARALIGLEKWSDARDILEKIIAARPGDTGAHAALGDVYQHEGNWQKAAEHFRKAAGR